MNKGGRTLWVRPWKRTETMTTVSLHYSTEVDKPVVVTSPPNVVSQLVRGHPNTKDKKDESTGTTL